MALILATICLPYPARAAPVVDCSASEDTAYVKGNPSPIWVVTFDEVPVSLEIVDPLYVMSVSALSDGVQLKVLSGFRTLAEQQYLYKCYIDKKNTGVCGCGSCNLAAKPGYSNHQSGHAVDIQTGCAQGESDASCMAKSATFSWLKANAAAFGFQKTVTVEPWHWEWWEGGPGGGICSGACESGCLSPSTDKMDPLNFINEDWIGGLCASDADCAYEAGFCFKEGEGFPQGMCSEGCTKYCPDAPGMVVTFCVDKDDVGVASPEGLCVAKCDYGISPSGCRPGYKCVELPRYNEPGTVTFTCVPDPNAPPSMSPEGWSLGLSDDSCATKLCSFAQGEVCTESLGEGPSCVPALCLDPVTHEVIEGPSCSYAIDEAGTSVMCSAQGELLSATECTNEEPCNACGQCGPAPSEICDGTDNDCDGTVDEGVLNACGSCGEVPAEICDGTDNDCDGVVDEDCADEPTGDLALETDVGPEEPHVNPAPTAVGERATQVHATSKQGEVFSGCQSAGSSAPGWLAAFFLIIVIRPPRRLS